MDNLVKMAIAPKSLYRKRIAIQRKKGNRVSEVAFFHVTQGNGLKPGNPSQPADVLSSCFPAVSKSQNGAIMMRYSKILFLSLGRRWHTQR